MDEIIKKTYRKWGDAHKPPNTRFDQFNSYANMHFGSNFGISSGTDQGEAPHFGFFFGVTTNR